MKKRISLLVVIAFVGAIQLLQAQIINVPDKSKEHFAKKYPKIKNADWSNNVTAYTASFNSGKDSYKAHYHMDGTWDYTEKFIDLSKCPSAVKTAYKNSRVADWKFESAAFLENNKGEKLYRLEAKKGIEKKFIFYDKSGKEVKSSSSL